MPQTLRQDEDDDSSTRGTMVLTNEDHTIGNALRYMLQKEYVVMVDD